MARLRVGVLISGRGSNLQALLNDLAREDAPARIACVIADNADADGLRRAATAGVAASVIDRRGCQDRESFERAISAGLDNAGVDLVCLAGFMHVLGAGFVRRWSGRLINIHPSLLPAYRGLDTHTRALADGAVEAGCTVHHVTEDLDAGPIIAQRRVPVFADDTPESLSARVLEQEHLLYPLVVRMIANRANWTGAKTAPI